MIDAVSAATRPGQSVVGLIRSDHGELENPVPADAQLTQSQVEEMVRHTVTTIAASWAGAKEEVLPVTQSRPW